MNMPGLKSLLLLSLATLFTPVFAQQQQGVNPARPGTLNYVEGQASIDGQQVTSGSIGHAELQAGQYLATGNGKAELLLTPGIFLRLDDNSTVKMIQPDLTHTEVSLERGHAQVEADQLYPQNTILIDQKNGQTQIVKNGLYDFNADNNTVRTFNGQALVFPGSDRQSNVKPIEVKGDRQITLAGEAVKTVKFDKNSSEDDLYRWGSLRSQYLGQANLELASRYADYGPNYVGWGPGWFWDSAFYGYTWMPGDGLFWNPYGFGFYSPFYLYGGGFVYGRGYYHPGYGYRGGYAVHGSFSHAPGASAAFRGGGGGFSGGGGGGGFHGGGRGR
jgi:hypothetical protein